MDLRGLIVKQSGSIRRFAQEYDLNQSMVYGILTRKRNASKSIMSLLETVFGLFVAN